MASKQLVNTAPDSIDDLLYVMCFAGINNTKYCGHKREYLIQNLTELEVEMLICKVCGGIIRRASLVQEETTCQMCSATPYQLNAVRLVENCVNKLGIKCPLLRDCEWGGKLSEAEDHLKECQYFLVQCSDCNQTVRRSVLLTHKQNTCPMREVTCQYCSLVGKMKNLTEHLTYCSGYRINCPNGCQIKFPRRQLSHHISECPLAEVECPYAKYGCRAKPMKRRALMSHKKEFIIEHVDMVETKNHELEVMNHELETKVNSFESELNTMKRLDGVKWELSDVDKLTDGRTVISPDFYVNKYKLKCLCKFECWFGNRRLNFSIQRVRGEHDNYLSLASITECRIMLQKSCGTQFCDNGDINYKLNIGTVSGVFYSLPCWNYSRFLTSDKVLSIKFYFDVDSTRPLQDSEVIQIATKKAKIDLDPFS